MAGWDTYATQIKSELESITDWSGQVHKMGRPLIRTERQALNMLVDDDNRVNAWFIMRTGISSRKYGEGRMMSQHRVKSHNFQVLGIKSMYDNPQNEELIPTGSSEQDFQDLCDDIESQFGNITSFGVGSHTVFIRNFDMTISVDAMGAFLAHVVRITFSVEEQLRTTYRQ